MKKLIWLFLFVNSSAFATPVIPNFQQGVLQQHSETRSVVQEDIKSYDIQNGYQLTVGGENVKSSTGDVAPAGWTKVNTTVDGVGTTYVSPNLDNMPTYSIVNEGDSFMFYQTLETGGITNYTHIMRTTEVQNITDSTSTFSQ